MELDLDRLVRSYLAFGILSVATAAARAGQNDRIYEGLDSMLKGIGNKLKDPTTYNIAGFTIFAMNAVSYLIEYSEMSGHK